MQNLTGNSISFLEEDYEKTNKIKTFKQNIYSKYVFNVNKAKDQDEKTGMVKYNQLLRDVIISCQESELPSIEDTIKRMKE